jgi:hypothetical protein
MNCIWQAFDLITKSCCVKIAADKLLTPELACLGTLRYNLTPEKHAKLVSGHSNNIGTIQQTRVQTTGPTPHNTTKIAGL